MKEYVRGAFEALAWAYVLLSDVKDTAGLEAARSQIDQALQKLRTSTAKEFLGSIQTE